MRLTETSEELDDLAGPKDWHDVVRKADAAGIDGDEHLCFEKGFDLAMKMVQMSTLSKYAGKDLKVFVIGAPDGSDELAYFIAADEDEIIARLTGLPEVSENS